MDHQEVLSTLASERYLLGEMTDTERDSFEEHFFSCAECAEDVTVLLDKPCAIVYRVSCGRSDVGLSIDRPIFLHFCLMRPRALIKCHQIWKKINWKREVFHCLTLSCERGCLSLAPASTASLLALLILAG